MHLCGLGYEAAAKQEKKTELRNGLKMNDRDCKVKKQMRKIANTVRRRRQQQQQKKRGEMYMCMFHETTKQTRNLVSTRERYKMNK